MAKRKSNKQVKAMLYSSCRFHSFQHKEQISPSPTYWDFALWRVMEKHDSNVISIKACD